MLARIAHELYWLGRNLVRAEITSRVVDGVFQVELQGTPNASPGVVLGWSELLTMLGEGDEKARVDRAEALQRLTLDPDAQSSMRACVERSREGARNVRDVISADMWEAINTSALTLRGDGDRSWMAPGGPYLSCQYVKERVALIGGLADRTMLRDEGYQFIRLGTFLERADNTARILSVKQARQYAAAGGQAGGQGSGGAAGSAGVPVGAPAGGDVVTDYYRLSAVLRSVSALEAYRDIYRDAIDSRRVAELLIFEPSVPRSLRFCFDEVERILAELPQEPGRYPRRLAAHMLALLEHGELDDVYEVGLDAFLDRFLGNNVRLGAAVNAAYMEIK